VLTNDDRGGIRGQAVNEDKQTAEFSAELRQNNDTVTPGRVNVLDYSSYGYVLAP